MEINLIAVGVCAVLAMVIGSIWYGPLFGKTWMRIVGATDLDIEARKKMQKASTWLYISQLGLAVFQVWVLAYYIQGWTSASGVVNAIWIWAAFVMPIIFGTAMWNNDSMKIKWSRFFVQSGYQLVCFVMFGLILGAW